MTDIISTLLSNPKEVLSAGFHSIELIKKLRTKSDEDPSIESILLEVQAGCLNTSEDLKNTVREMRLFFEKGRFDIDKTIDKLCNEQKLYQIVNRISLNRQRKKLIDLTNGYSQFIEDASAVLACGESDQATEVLSSAYTSAINRRRDFDKQMHAEMSIGAQLSLLTKYADQIHTELKRL